MRPKEFPKREQTMLFRAAFEQHSASVMQFDKLPIRFTCTDEHILLYRTLTIMRLYLVKKKKGGRQIFSEYQRYWTNP